MDLLDGDGILRTIVAAEESTDRQIRRTFRLARLAEPRPCGASRVLATGEPELVVDLTNGWLRDAAQVECQLVGTGSPAPHSAIVVPMTSRGATIGVLSLLRCARQQRYTNVDPLVAVGLADRAALALDNAQLYTAAVEARQRRDEMLSVVSHDLRNPLHVIAINAEHLEQHGASRGLTAIRRAADRAARLVQDLLAISAIESGRSPGPGADHRGTAAAPLRSLLAGAKHLYRRRRSRFGHRQGDRRGARWRAARCQHSRRGGDVHHRARVRDGGERLIRALHLGASRAR